MLLAFRNFVQVSHVWFRHSYISIAFRRTGPVVVCIRNGFRANHLGNEDAGRYSAGATDHR